MITVFVDADACPVTNIVERISMEYELPVVLLCDTNHVIRSDYGTVIIIGSGADAVDLALINRCSKGDIVVTQDYGVAALALGKGAYPIHQNGNIYSDDNIDGLLMTRHINKKARNSKSKHHIKGPKKRTQKDNINFEKSFRNLIESIIK